MTLSDGSGSRILPAGLPPPDGKWRIDARSRLHKSIFWLCRRAGRAEFRAYGLLDERVRFLEGCVRRYCVPAAPIERLAVAALDGDLYRSTISVETFYDRVSPGGFIIVDDYALPPARRRLPTSDAARGIATPIEALTGAVCSGARKPCRRLRGLPGAMLDLRQCFFTPDHHIRGSLSGTDPMKCVTSGPGFAAVGRRDRRRQ